MRDVTLWSVSCGRIADVEIRLHASLFLASAVWLHLAGLESAETSTVGAIVGLAVYWASLALHEWGHCAAAWRLGGRIERIIIGPLGGLGVVGRSADARDDLIQACAGPAANFAASIACAVVLAALQQPLASILFLFAPPAMVWQSSLVGAAAWGAWINLLLALVNLVPSHPLDGARVAAAFLRERMDPVEASIRAARVGVFAAFACLIAAFLLGRNLATASLLLSVLGIAAFFCSRAEFHVAATGDDFDENETEYPPTEEARPPAERFGSLRRWWRKRREERRLQVLETERAEEERADEILARLHSLGGREALSAEDRALLERVSARYRHRQRG